MMFTGAKLVDFIPLANHLWQSTLFAAVVWLLTLALKKNRAAIRYWLWFAASVKFLIPFSLLVSVGSKVEWRPAPDIIQPQWSSVADGISRPFAFSVPIHQVGALTGSNSLPVILLCVWICGFSLSMGWWLRKWGQIRAIRRAAVPLTLGLPIQVMSTSRPIEPGIFGLYNPVLLLPDGISDNLTPSQLDAVIAHEICHVNRHDNLTAAIHMVVEAVFWFYPLLWLIRTRLIEERERACDEAVLQMGGDAEIYAEGILNVCKLYVESSLTCVSGISGSDLKKRLVRILKHRLPDKLNFSGKLYLASMGIAAIVLPVGFGLLNANQIWAQAQVEGTIGNNFVYEVASVRAQKSGDGMFKIGWPGESGFVAKGATLRMLIRLAYEVDDYQISAGPNRLDSDRYDIEAKTDPSVVDQLHKLSEHQRKLAADHMLQALLADRFNLRLHRETKEIPVYVLVVAKNGPKLHETKAITMMRVGWNEFVSLGVPLKLLVDQLSMRLGRTVLDHTGLKGSYAFTLRWTPDENQVPMLGGTHLSRPRADNSPSSDSSGPSIFTAVEEQLGLKLKSEKAPMETLVIDHVEKPSEN